MENETEKEKKITEETKTDDKINDDNNNVNVIDADIEKSANYAPSEENSPIAVVAAAVSTKDDPTLPCLTFRFWILSSFFTMLGSMLSQFYYFRSNGATYSIFFVILIAHLFGKWMEKLLPTHKFKFGKYFEFTFNPGPFNTKEHVCIVAAASAGGVSAYASDIIVIQDLFYGQSVSFVPGFLLLLSTQAIGYGLAGFLRKYLVRPANMIWPVNLVYSTMLDTLHANENDTRKKLRFFFICFFGIFVWQFIPQYVFLFLSSIAVLCLISPYSDVMVNLGSGYKGVGMLNFSLDWNAIGFQRPLYTPWWAQVNFFAGVILSVWVIAPILYYTDVLQAKSFPFMTTHSVDRDGNRYNQTRIINPETGSFDQAAYDSYSPVYLSTMFAMCYAYSFACITSTISHVVLFHGEEIWARFKASRAEEEEDIHCKLMRAYPEVPNSWYGALFVAMLAISIPLGYVTGANLPWWALLLAIALAIIMVLPIGVIQAISTNQVGLNVITEMVCGYLLPGRPIANVYFKCYGYMAMYQSLLFVQDLKLGHYMKIPPKAMFYAQIWGTVIGALVNFWSMQIIIDTKRAYLDGTEDDPTGQWTGYNSEIFNTASIIWGLIGPAKTFGAGTLYSPLLWGFLAGFIMPIPFYLLHKKFPQYRFDLVNMPVFTLGLSLLPGYYTNFITMGLIASFLSQYYAFRYRNRWWTKYNYVLSSALDSGAQIATMAIFFFLNGIPNIKFPSWWGNDPSSQGERCYGSSG